MKYVFSAIGGSASNYLVKVLSTKYNVGNKPDTIFRPKISKLKIGNMNKNQGTLKRRAPGFSEIPNETIDSFLVRYINYIKSSEMRTAVFNTCAELALFSKNSITDVIFLLRHPLHTYASWSKPDRHGDVIEYLGGVNSEKAILHFAKRWNAVVDEILKLRKKQILGGLIRYEFATSDVNYIPEIRWAFENFDIYKRNHGFLSKKAEVMLRNITYNNFCQLYSDWDI